MFQPDEINQLLKKMDQEKDHEKFHDILDELMKIKIEHIDLTKLPDYSLNGPAMFFLGNCYYFGDFVPKDINKAASFFRVSHINKCKLGTRALGFYYVECEKPNLARKYLLEIGMDPHQVEWIILKNSF
jgi:TPR repeat protein